MSTRGRPTDSLAVVLAVLLVAGCGPRASVVPGSPAPSASAGPPASSASATARPSASASTVASAGPSARPVIAAGEPWILFQTVADGRTRIALVRPDGSDRHLLDADIPADRGQVHPAWSPEGDRVALEVRVPRPNGDDAAEIWIAGVDGSDARAVARCDLPCLQLADPAWSPDGGGLAFARYDLEPDGSWGASAIVVLDLATGARRALATTPDGTSSVYRPRWSPDGSRLVVELETYADASQERVRSSQLVVVDAEGTPGALEPITAPDVFAGHAAWWPGDRIVYVSTAFGADLLARGSLATIDADGRDARPLTSVAEGDPVALEPRWTAAGGDITFVTVRDSALRFGTVEPEGEAFGIAEWSFPPTPDGLHRTYAQLRPGA